MKQVLKYREIEGKSTGFWILLGGLGALIALALGAVLYMEHEGHYVTGMTNQIVWGMPHVFAIFLIVTASGILNPASIGTVFGKTLYKPLGRLSALLAISMLVGGLMILVLDLGHPDRLIIAMTYYNFKSIFAWNIILYNGFLAVVAIYIWLMMERKMNKYYPAAGFIAFIWRLILTTGTGSIFGFLVARQAYDAALLAPMFVIMSFAYGLAVFILVLMAAYAWTKRPLGDAVLFRLKNLLGVFIASVLYFVAVYHLTNLYAAENNGVEHFILMDGGIYTKLFWIVQILIGSLLPLAMVYHPTIGKSRPAIATAAALVIIGGFAQLYVLLIGGQAYPLEMFPGYEVTSSFFDGQVSSYSPSIWEITLGVGGIATALLMVTIAVRVLKFLPVTLEDAVVDPHAAKTD
ncbi:molybdopterin-containing oxidoreductase family membrane subunit [Thiogranum longum]|uniref:Molybdopterin-containing oxidoreductase family membrane subunit n=1 Tax=Thiogranum longum TaxID=1537524 RepID=A0A4R1H9F5_9GAMM|nr:NrfD/PsrC family molybdoenzyme membrane anchor subunit [Thiogranum longum]TCK18517.1 molybdopterin-containing oxidoreductase family membrane subunit [Thiogranum longum]